MLSDKMEASGAYDEVEDVKIFGGDSGSAETTDGSVTKDLKQMQINDTDKAIVSENSGEKVCQNEKSNAETYYIASASLASVPQSSTGTTKTEQNRKASTLHAVKSTQVNSVDDPLAMLRASVGASGTTVDISRDISDTIEPSLPSISPESSSKRKNRHAINADKQTSTHTRPSSIHKPTSVVRPRQTKWARDPTVAKPAQSYTSESAYDNERMNGAGDDDSVMPTHSKDSSRLSSDYGNEKDASSDSTSSKQQRSDRYNNGNGLTFSTDSDTESVERRKSIRSNVDTLTRKKAKYSITIPEWKRFENGTSGSMLAYLPMTSDVILYRVRVVVKRNAARTSSNTTTSSTSKSSESSQTPKKPKVVILYRSFSDFQALHAAIKEHYLTFCPQQQHTIPIPPQKEWLWKDHSNPGFLENRRVLLEQWLNSVCLLEYAEDCPKFKTFMMPSKA
ncbi:hypothetical protein SARC_01296 [Sphaeroforma arctica JP610]|uniref:PX domain-containing protein n=1 Tax=Sphaeroforma arctica JP610 TaxID=667725 RepID=A0A0L0GEB8_9EUKA|nr:hypothetical protein SARC_01296 [Sphaeroforma arctica JP610]KNC86573.1 hypothetical protein SARC_01296 [Sphaeroforma arctica JP610]|eukprot:XP_014160475.1 hypothetical protein SARC_01296 [Sphaeroforma arctica JP610]